MAQEQMSEVLLEFVPQGRFVKVTAIDPISGREVSVVGDRMASPETLKRIAVNKLRYVLGKTAEAVRNQGRDDNLY
jgi:hypothetical protein